jgi:2-dehydro-3-deoxyglucarate aldolase
MVIAQIEHIEAVEHLDEILATPGLDAVFIGPSDLSSSMGLFGQWDHPQFVSILDRIIKTATGAGMPIGMAVDSTPTKALERIAQGIKFVTLGVDWGWMRQGATAALEEVRESRLTQAVR